jgi:sulfur relay (sulfurtransferase) DsrF/TusC family protein
MEGIMSEVTMILRKSPYGDINAAEAIRHVMGGIDAELDISLILVDSGVLLAKKGQDPSGSGFTNLEKTLQVCINMETKVYADKPSVKEHNLDQTDIVDGVQIIDTPEIAEIIKGTENTIIF